jgi:hypothetical protein
VIEVTWVLISLFAAVYTVRNWSDAREARLTLDDLEPDELTALRAIVAFGNVRRELVRMVSIAGCLVIVIPSLLRPGDTPLSVFVIAAMLIPAGLAVNSYLDRQMRLHVEQLVEKLALA